MEKKKRPRKNGRPRLPDELRLGTMRMLRLTDDQSDWLDEQADQRATSAQQIVRNLIAQAMAFTPKAVQR